MNSIYIFLGGGVGAILRNFITYLSTTFISKNWPGTLIANTLGVFLLFSLSETFRFIPKEYHGAVRVGLIGALTTFSTFIFEIIKAYKEGRSIEAVLIFILNILFGIFIGIRMAR